MVKPVLVTSFVYANLMSYLTTGISQTGIIHIMNKTPIYCYSKSQSCVETSTYVSKSAATPIVLTRLLTFIIPYAILSSLSRYSMGQMLHSFLVINYWLSIRLSCLPVNSNLVLTLLTTISLGKQNQRALSSLCTRMSMITLMIF